MSSSTTTTTTDAPSASTSTPTPSPPSAPTPASSSTPTLPTIAGYSLPPISILLINPNSTPHMTTACLTSLAPTLPPGVTVTGFTAPRPAPSAIEGHLDGVLSAAECIRALLPHLHDEDDDEDTADAPGARRPKYDAFLVACFSAHPLIAALREEVPGPVVGIMEAALYAARMVGGRVGVVATAARSVVMHEDAIRGYGLAGHSVGAEGTGMGVLELETLEQEEVARRMCDAAEQLVGRGADCVCLGCAGMVGLREKVAGRVGDGVQVVDGVGVGVQFLVGLVREGLRTGKAGAYASAGEGRRRRGQAWV
ncbi:hypothetical protein MMC34_005720 [Xylographa carneopallida]|nr:hypothetical protein [Xylographa carneopallida]